MLGGYDASHSCAVWKFSVAMCRLYTFGACACAEFVSSKCEDGLGRERGRDREKQAEIDVREGQKGGREEEGDGK
eukprot:6211228-Pleurochrysis_carterae.AAC.1